jgi:hypothetical protein
MIVRRLSRDKARYWLLARQGVELSEVTMPAKRYKVTLEPDERGDLEKLMALVGFRGDGERAQATSASIKEPSKAFPRLRAL